MTMHFLGLYNLAAVLTIVGACCVSTGAAADDLDDAGFDDVTYSAVNPEGGAELLPTPGYVINAPLSYVDNGYNPTYYWNQPENAGYALYPPPSYGRGYWYGYHKRARAAAIGNWHDNAGDYGGGLGEGARPAYRWRYAHRAHHRDMARVMRDREVREAALRSRAHRADVSGEAAPVHRPHVAHGGYNGHDRGMFENR